MPRPLTLLSVLSLLAGCCCRSPPSPALPNDTTAGDAAAPLAGAYCHPLAVATRGQFYVSSGGGPLVGWGLPHRKFTVKQVVVAQAMLDPEGQPIRKSPVYLVRPTGDGREDWHVIGAAAVFDSTAGAILLRPGDRLYCGNAPPPPGMVRHEIIYP